MYGLWCKLFQFMEPLGCHRHAVAVDGCCGESLSQWMTVMVDAHLTVGTTSPR